MMVDRQNLSSPGSETLDVGLEYYLQTTCALGPEMIEYIRIRFGFESFYSNLEYSDLDSTIFEPEYYSNIRIFFLKSRIFET